MHLLRHVRKACGMDAAQLVTRALPSRVEDAMFTFVVFERHH
jgi:hypothetical protein